MAKILILGAAGNFGSALADALHSKNHEIIYFDNLSSGKNENIKHGPLVKASIIESNRIERALREYHCDWIINTVTDFDSRETDLQKRKDQIENLMSALQAAKEIKETRLFWFCNEGSKSLPQISEMANLAKRRFHIQIELIILKNFSPNFSYFDSV